LCYFLKLFFECNQKHTTFNSQCALSFCHPPLQKCRIFSIQWCVCIQGYVKFIKLCTFTKVKMPSLTFAFHPFKCFFMKTSFIASNITILNQMSLWASNLVHSKLKLFVKSYKLHYNPKPKTFTPT
jgi:hypothetical protein